MKGKAREEVRMMRAYGHLTSSLDIETLARISCKSVAYAYYAIVNVCAAWVHEIR